MLISEKKWIHLCLRWVQTLRAVVSYNLYDEISVCKSRFKLFTAVLVQFYIFMPPFSAFKKFKKRHCMKKCIIYRHSWLFYIIFYPHPLSLASTAASTGQKHILTGSLKSPNSVFNGLATPIFCDFLHSKTTPRVKKKKLICDQQIPKPSSPRPSGSTLPAEFSQVSLYCH